MPTLNFPSNPDIGNTYSFGGKTWVWTADGAWKLQDSGAINGIPIGNVTPSSGAFTTLSATGNITGSYILGNGSQLSGIITSVANINSGTTILEVVSSGGNIRANVGGVGNVWVLATTGAYVTGLTSVTGNVIAGNVTTSGLITATGNVDAGNLRTAGLVSATGTITGANITGSNFITAGLITATGNISSAANIAGGNILTGGLVSATGTITGANITGSNFITAGLITATGNIDAGNLRTAGLVSATGTITGANITGSNFITAGLITATGNVTAGNLLTGGLISTVGNIYTGADNAGFVFGNAFYMTGISSAISVTKIENGSSNVWVRDPGGDVTVTAGGVSNVAVFSTGSLTVLGAVGNPKSMVGNVVIADGINATMVGPIEWGIYSLTIPDSSTVYIIPG